MELDHDFTVPVPVDQAWSVLLDVERVAACMPGATLDAVEGEEYRGRMRVKVGAMTITYRGTARIVSADESSRVVTMEASAKEARGSGTAAATVRATLHGEGGTTRVAVHTKLNVTGRPAQFGRNILAEVGAKIIARFAKQLAAELESSGEPAAASAPAGSAPRSAARSAAKPGGKTASKAAGKPAEKAAPKAAESPREAARPEVEAETGVASARPAEPADKPGPVKVEPEKAEAAKTEPAKAEPAKAEVAEPAAPARPAQPARRPPHVAGDDDAIDLLEVAGPSVAKRAVPAAALVALLLVIRFLVRRRRRKG